MRAVGRFAGVLAFFSSIYGASFGTVVPIVGGASDLTLDEPRGRIYLPNTNADRVEVYSIPQRRFLTAIRVESQPLASALSRDGRTLYVTCHAASSLMEIDAESMTVRNRVSLPARPEGVAVGFDERVLISTVGTGQNNLQNVLLIYNPSASGGEQSLTIPPIQPPPAANPLLPPNNFGRGGLISRSFLDVSRDGRFIFGMNLPNAQARSVFVYEVASGTVLRSRTIAGVSSVMSAAPDGSKFMAGLTLIDAESLTVLAQQNAANAPYNFPPGTNFNLQQNQGGSVFAPDGSKIYSAFNFNPVEQPPVRPNVSQLMVSDPDNLLIDTAYQLAENIAGKIDITEDGNTIYALSESGMLIIPVGQARENPIITLDTTVKLLANDQCGVTAPQRVSTIQARNLGRGRITAQAQLLQAAPVGPVALGGAGGPGGGAPAGAIIIQIPVAPIAGGGVGGGIGGGGAVGGGQAALPGGNNQANNVAATAPRTRTQNVPEGVNFEFTYNPINRSQGTVSPTHQYILQSPEAINIPPTVRIFQNNRNSEARGDVLTVEVGTSANEGLVDMILDQPRQRLYVANSGKNRIEVLDTRTKTLLEPIKAGQLPRSMAISVDGLYLYVGNNGAESISIIDLDKRETVGRVRFPAVPFNNNTALIRPELIAATLRGPLVIMSDGTLWKVTGDTAQPRLFNTGVLPTNQGRQVIPAPRTLAVSPGGETVLLLAGNGFAYLYDANSDDFVASRQVVTNPITGYYGPVAVGPRGQYFLVNGNVLNSSLTQTATAGTSTAAGPVRPGQAPAQVPRPVASVAAVNNTQFARFVQPVIQQANILVQGLNETSSIEIVEVQTGRTLATAAGLERPLSTPVGNQRANVTGRSMAVDAANNTAYVLTTSGISVIPLDQVNPQNRPALNPNAVTNVASGLPQVAQGGLVSIAGRNLAAAGSSSTPAPPTVLGGACVTLNELPLPLLSTAPGQINTQIPPALAPGRYPLVVRNVDGKIASQSQTVTVVKYAPAVFLNEETKQAQVFRLSDNKPITKSDPAKRDVPLVMFAAGLGPTKGAPVVLGQPVPASPPAVTDAVEVFFGDPRLAQSEVIVDWSGLVPGLIGIYQLNLRVPGFHGRGQALPVSIKIGNVSSPTTGANVPTVAVD